MNTADDHQATRTYYDDFSTRYEDERRPNRPDGYHALIDDMEVDLVDRYGAGGDVLECGCGTGLILERIARSARSARGIDLSPKMIDRARARGLDVSEASVTAIPIGDESFDVTCAFKVLAHVPQVGRALAEMARVTRKGGVVIGEFYNPLSVRGFIKRFAPPGRVSHRTRESAVYTRFDPPWVIPRVVPGSLSIEAVRGVRIVTPTAGAMRVPGVRGVLRRMEWWLADTPAAFFAGFYVVVMRKGASSRAGDA
jgi:ubiquinone/menaquinone biosynthesis C-methylase UbiE